MNLISGIFHYQNQKMALTDLANAVRSQPGRDPGFSRHIEEARRSAFVGHVLHDLASGLAVVADVRLDDRQNLCAKLGTAPTERAEVSDLQLILLSYQKWGQACPEHLVGDYAFVIFNSTKQSVFCARDHIGARPFYYSTSVDGAFAFASDLRVLLNISNVSQQLDDTYVAGYLNNATFVHSTRTFYRDIHKLPPGHSLTIDCRFVETQRQYWSPENVPDNHQASDSEYSEGLLDCLNKSVTDRLPTDGVVGSHISGGLDCSGVAVLAARQLRSSGRTLPTFSWSVPPEEDSKELRSRVIIDEIAATEAFPVRYRPMITEPILPLEDVSCQPYFDLGAERSVAKLAAEQGVQLMLSGWGGDEVASFNGRGYYVEQLLSGHWKTLATELNARSNSGSESPFRKMRRLARVTWNCLGRSLLPIPKSWTRPRQYGIPDCLNAEFAAHLRSLEVPEETWPRWTSVRQTMNALVNHGHIATRMEHWAAYGAEYGLDYAYPLTDRRVMEFCLGAPARQFLRHGVTRVMFREAMKTVLPESSRSSTKQEQAISTEHGQCHPRLHAELTALLAEIDGDSNWGQCLDIKQAQQQLRGWTEDQGRPGRQVLKQIVRAVQIDIVYQNQGQHQVETRSRSAA